MAKSFYDFNEQFLSAILKRDAEKARKKWEYEQKLKELRKRKQNLFTRLFDRKLLNQVEPELDLSEFEQLPDLSLAERGQIFAIRYGDIISSISGLRVYYSRAYIQDAYDTSRKRVDEIELDTKGILGDIAKLWTVVEYIGDGQYIDLVTNEVLVIPTKAEKAVLETVTQSSEKEARRLQETLLQYPLGIRSCEIIEGMNNFDSVSLKVTHFYGKLLTDELFPDLKSLDSGIEKMILQNTLPREDEIKAKLAELKQAARAGLKEYFEKINEKTMNAYYEDAMKRSKEMQLEDEKVEQEQRKKETEEEFDRVFSPRRKLASAKIYSLKYRNKKEE